MQYAGIILPVMQYKRFSCIVVGQNWEEYLMNVKIIRHPTQEDWDRAKYLALNTAGKRMVSQASEDWNSSP